MPDTYNTTSPQHVSVCVRECERGGGREDTFLWSTFHPVNDKEGERETDFHCIHEHTRKPEGDLLWVLLPHHGHLETVSKINMDDLQERGQSTHTRGEGRMLVTTENPDRRRGYGGKNMEEEFHRPFQKHDQATGSRDVDLQDPRYIPPWT